MGNVAQKLDRLEIRVESRRLGRDHVDEDRRRPGAQHAARLAQARRRIAPMMRGKTAGAKIEMRVGKGQAFRAGFNSLDIGKASPARLFGDGGEHIG